MGEEIVQMQLAEGKRVLIEGATGDRERFNGRGGELVELRPRRHPGAEPFALVRLDGRGNVRGRGYRVFLPRELRVDEERF